MSTGESLLIVEDETEWRAIFQRVGKRQGFTEIQTAGDLRHAEEILDRQKFAVAFVDVGLDVEDDSNVDGLRVMERIRALGDETSIIVVTGRSGTDVVSITRDALRNFEAFDAVGKAPVEPAELQRLLTAALHSFKTKEAKHRMAAHDVLRGEVPVLEWDDRMLRALNFRHGVEGLYRFTQNLLGRFLPVIPLPEANAVLVDAETEVAQGVYWSRAVGDPILVVFGPDRAFTSAVDRGGPVFGVYQKGKVLHSTTAADIKGAVYLLSGLDRARFGRMGAAAGG